MMFPAHWLPAAWERALRRRRAARRWRSLSLESRLKAIADKLPDDVNLIGTSIAGGPETYALEYVDAATSTRWVAPLGSPLPQPGKAMPNVWVVIQ